MLNKTTLSLLKVVLPLLLCFVAVTAHAQIFETVHADIHHQFVVGATTLPAGHYTFQVMPRSGQNLMTVTSADGKTKAVVLVRSSQAAANPQQTELVFAPGDTQSLSNIYSAGNKYGLKVLQGSPEEILQSRMRNPIQTPDATPQGVPTSAAPDNTTVGR